MDWEIGQLERDITLLHEAGTHGIVVVSDEDSDTECNGVNKPHKRNQDRKRNAETAILNKDKRTAQDQEEAERKAKKAVNKQIRAAATDIFKRRIADSKLTLTSFEVKALIVAWEQKQMGVWWLYCDCCHTRHMKPSNSRQLKGNYRPRWQLEDGAFV